MPQTPAEPGSPARKRGAASLDDLERTRASLRTALLTARNPDGGWAYSSGKKSRLEATCWALLALSHEDALKPDVGVLRQWRQQDGWLTDVPGAPPNHAFNALAALTLLEADSDTTQAQALGARLVAAKGIRAGQVSELRQDNGIQGWAWLDGTFSWVEPTTWSLLLLKKMRSRNISLQGADGRINDGERLLIDRVCEGGGWNYGNSNVYGQELWPYVPTTALGLLAMRDHRAHPVVEKSLQQLQRDVRTERSPMAIALAIICLRAYGIGPGTLVDDLIERIRPTGSTVSYTGGILAQAMALYALVDARPATSFTW